jgi:glycosyltransferase involved in cell wall biosynthesis
MDVLRKSCPSVELRILTGQIHDRVPLWVNASDVVLLTSTHEGWPNIIKEALACNVPFVSTDVSDLKTLAAAEPSCSVTDATPEALAEGLLNALQQDGRPPLRRYAEPMEVSAIGSCLGNLYRTVCSARSLAAAD